MGNVWPDCSETLPYYADYCCFCSALNNKKYPRNIEYKYVWDRLVKGIEPVDKEYLSEHMDRISLAVVKSDE